MVLSLLVGRRSNRDAVGTQVRVEGGGGAQVFELREGSSYLSQNERILHIGLGERRQLERLSIRWPGSDAQILEPLEADRLAVVVQDVGVVASFPFRR